LKLKPESKIVEKKEKSLDMREEKVVRNLLAGMSKKDALMSAGYAKSTAEDRAADVIGKPRIQKRIEQLMDERGLDDGTFLTTLQEGLEANKVISAMVIAKDGEGMKDANSMTKDFFEVPDYDARHKYLVTGLKLKGHLKESKSDVNLLIETHEQRLKRLRGEHDEHTGQ
jgi:phage terminase small subunit